VDSGSTDGTLEIASRHTQVEILHRPFDDFANQCNFGLSHVGTDWLLSLDADYVLTTDIVDEIHRLKPTDNVGCYQAHFVYCVHGKPLRGSLYPPRSVLHRRRGALYRNEGHSHRVSVPGDVLTLSGAIFHDDRKPLTRWIASQQVYAAQEAKYLLTTDPKTLNASDRLRVAIWPAPLLVFPYVLFAKGCIFDGWVGWFYAMQRLIAETMVALAVLNRRLDPMVEDE
jgi:glycosyltransferase involved in cell wall biosynthesis